jgi:hypothetical protein
VTLAPDDKVVEPLMPDDFNLKEGEPGADILQIFNANCLPPPHSNCKIGLERMAELGAGAGGRRSSGGFD